MQPPQQLIDAIYAEKVRRARNMAPEEKLLAGAELFEYVRSISLAGIRRQNPTASREQLRLEFRRRLAISRRLDARP